MKIIPLGVGDAFSNNFYNTNFIVNISNKIFLLDAGTTLRYSLPQAGYSCKDIDGVFITHFHGDHVGGLEEFAQRCKYEFNRFPDLYVAKGQTPYFESLFGLGGVSPDFYLNIKNVEEIGILLYSDELKNLKYILRFIPTTGFHSQVKLNYMIEIEIQDFYQNIVKRVIFTGDIGNIKDSGLYEKVLAPETVAVFHDCFTYEDENPAHSSLKVISKTYPQEALSKLHLIHYGDNILEKLKEFDGLNCKIAHQGEEIKINE